MDQAIAAHNSVHRTNLARSNGTYVRNPVTNGFTLLLADSHEDVFDAAGISRAEVQGRRKANEFHLALKSSIDGWQNSYLSHTGPQPGIREGRRVQGLATVAKDDVLEARKNESAGVARCG